MIKPSGRTVVLTIDDSSKAGEARRAAVHLAEEVGFDETGRGKVALVATETATNLFKHAQGGEIVLQALESGTSGGIDILALDRGPGMADLARCSDDGYSTAGSSGTGLGAIARLSSLCDIRTVPGEGTSMLARLWSQPLPRTGGATRLEFGAVNLPLMGEEVCGDSWGIEKSDGSDVLLVVDGLGHGLLAADAAREAVRIFSLRSSDAPAEILKSAHAALRSTRGAAVAIARIDRELGEVRYAGVGNIGGVIFDPAGGRSVSMVSHNGTVGHTIRKTQEFVYPWTSGSTLIMFSDGLASHWHLEKYSGLGMSHPGVVAGVLYRDFQRGRDDVTVLVARDMEATYR